MHKKYAKLINQLVQGYHLENSELDDLEGFLQANIRQIEMRREKKENEGKKLMTSYDGYKFEQISKEEALKIWERKGTLFVVNIYDKQDSQIHDKKTFDEVLNSKEDVFCIDTINQN